MIKILSIVFFSVSFSFAVAGERTCDDIGLEQAYPSKDVQGVTACFVYTKISLEYPKKRRLNLTVSPFIQPLCLESQNSSMNFRMPGRKEISTMRFLCVSKVSATRCFS